MREEEKCRRPPRSVVEEKAEKKMEKNVCQKGEGESDPISNLLDGILSQAGSGVDRQLSNRAK